MCFCYVTKFSGSSVIKPRKGFFAISSAIDGPAGRYRASIRRSRLAVDHYATAARFHRQINAVVKSPCRQPNLGAFASTSEEFSSTVCAEGCEATRVFPQYSQ